MRLSAKAIPVFNTVNSFSYGNQWIVRAGDANTLYFQVLDLDQGPANTIAGLAYGNYPTAPLSGSVGLRYLVGINVVSPATSGITVTFPSIDDTKTIVATATPVSASDTSLWQVNIPAAAQPGGGNVIFTVTEGTAVRTFAVTNLLAVEYPNSSGSC